MHYASLAVVQEQVDELDVAGCHVGIADCLLFREEETDEVQ